MSGVEAVPGHWEGDLIAGPQHHPRSGCSWNEQPDTSCCCICPTGTVRSKFRTPWLNTPAVSFWDPSGYFAAAARSEVPLVDRWRCWVRGCSDGCICRFHRRWWSSSSAISTAIVVPVPPQVAVRPEQLLPRGQGRCRGQGWPAVVGLADASSAGWPGAARCRAVAPQWPLRLRLAWRCRGLTGLPARALARR
jgi:hypothetical protein